MFEVILLYIAVKLTSKFIDDINYYKEHKNSSVYIDTTVHLTVQYNCNKRTT